MVPNSQFIAITVTHYYFPIYRLPEPNAALRVRVGNGEAAVAHPTLVLPAPRHFNTTRGSHSESSGR